MKQKIVIKISTNCPKCRTKALQIAVSLPGVTSVQLDGDERNKIVVTGEGIDSTYLTVKLRKKVGCTDLISVTPITEAKKVEKKVEKKEEKEESSVNPHQYGMHQQPCWKGTPHPIWHEIRYYHDDQPSCTIM